MANIIELRNVYKSFDDKVFINGINLSIEQGEILSIVGEKNSGKSTLLGLINGRLKPTNGSIKMLNKEITSLKENALNYFMQINLGFADRNVTLSSNLTVEENIEYPLRIFGENKIARKLRVQEVLNIVGLPEEDERVISNLSEVEKLKAVLGKALVMRPRIILLDEPYSNNENDRGTISSLIKTINAKYGITFIIASSDIYAENISHTNIKIQCGVIAQEFSQAISI